MKRMLCLIVFLLAACSEPAPTAPIEAKPNPNPFAGTALDQQGKAIEKAKDVQRMVDEQAEARRRQIEAAEGG